MKKPLLISLTALAVLGVTTATTLYAQTTTGSSVIARMKAAATAFTLSADLNPGQTGFESAPVSWKKTGNILTAAEWNRMLELVAQGGTGGGSGISVELWKCTCGGYINMVTTQNLTFGETCVFGNGGTASNVQYSSWSCTKIQNAWGTAMTNSYPPILCSKTGNSGKATGYAWDITANFAATDCAGGVLPDTANYIGVVQGMRVCGGIEHFYVTGTSVHAWSNNLCKWSSGKDYVFDVLYIRK